MYKNFCHAHFAIEVDSDNEAKELEKKFKNEFLALLIKKKRIQNFDLRKRYNISSKLYEMEACAH